VQTTIFAGYFIVSILQQ